MALTKVSRSLLNTGVADSSDATAITIDSSENVTLASDLLLADSKKIKLGGGNDLEIYHDGSNSFISEVGTGNFYIQGAGTIRVRGATTEENMIEAVENGAVTLYYDNSSMLATTTSGIQLEEHLYLKDSKRIYLGTGTDLQIWHDGSNSYIADNGTGDLYLSAADNFYVRKAGTSEVIFKGTADGAAELYYDDSKKLETVTGGVTVTGALTANGGVVVDNTTIDGNSWTTTGGGMTIDVVSDITLDADGGNIYFKHAGTTIGSFSDSSSDFVITSGVQDKDIIFKGDDGGSAITALTLDMSDAGTATFNHDIKLGDNSKVHLGAGTDFSVYHTGSHGYAENNTGDLILLNNANDKDIIFQSDDGAGSTTTYFRLDGSAATHDGSNTTATYTKFPDNSYLTLGTGDDLQIYHDGSYSYIKDAGTGDLRIQASTNVQIYNSALDKQSANFVHLRYFLLG